MSSTAMRWSAGPAYGSRRGYRARSLTARPSSTFVAGGAIGNTSLLAVMRNSSRLERRSRRSPLVVRAAKAPPPPVASDLIQAFEDDQDDVPLLPVYSRSIDEGYEALEPDMSDYNLRYLFDGGCSICTSLVKMLKSRKGHELIYFEDISAPTFSPKMNKDITYDEAMESIHVITLKDDKIVVGMPALSLLYEQVGLGWMFKLAQLPLLSAAAALIYKVISKNRLAMGSGMDSMLALGRINMEETGSGTCEADGECRNDPSVMSEGDEDSKGSEAANGDSKSAEPLLKGADRDHILGVYLVQRGAALRAAPIDVQTGEFITNGAMRPINGTTLSDVIEAVKDIDVYFKWQGNLGISMPGLVTRDHEPVRQSGAPEKEGSLDLENDRECRHSMETQLRDAVARDVSVMTGSEANGFGEMSYGAGRGEKGLVLTMTLGRGMGVALFDEGVLVRNVEFPSIWSWDLAMWENAGLPNEDCEDEEAWARWAERVQNYVHDLEDQLQLDVIIISGAAQRSFKKWATLVKPKRATLKNGQLGQLAGVKGAAAGASFLLKMRDDISKVRVALGKQLGVSPQKISQEQLQGVYAKFACEEELLDLASFESALVALGVKIPKAEVREIMYEMDEDGSGNVTFAEFAGWWRSYFPPEADVEFIHTEAEFDQVLEEEEASNRLVVLEIGFTFCRPCKAFEPTYHAFAQKYNDARFLRAYGNENTDMMHLGRDRLGVTATPSFYFLRRGKVVASHSGSNHSRFENAIRSCLLEGEAEYEPNFQPQEEVPNP